MTTETTCPLCGLPRPKGATKCVCNYTFEYTRGGGGGRGARPRNPVSMMSAAVVAAAAVAAAIAFVLGAGVRMPGDAAIGPWFFLLVGVFAIAGGFFDWSFFMGSRRASRFVLLFGREGARVFYGLLGGALLGFGLRLLTA